MKLMMKSEYDDDSLPGDLVRDVDDLLLGGVEAKPLHGLVQVLGLAKYSAAIMVKVLGLGNLVLQVNWLP